MKGKAGFILFMLGGCAVDNEGKAFMVAVLCLFTGLLLMYQEGKRYEGTN